MAKRCTLVGTKPQSGNNVSHSKRRTRRRFLPNIQAVSLHSEILGTTVKMKVTTATLRSVEHNGGLDNFLLSAKAHNLTDEAQALRRKVKKAQVAAQ